MKKLSVVILIVYTVVFFLMNPACSKAKKEDFNIILICIDTLRADHLSCYKYSKATSPNIDAFREDAVLFRRCMAQSASTLPSQPGYLELMEFLCD